MAARKKRENKYIKPTRLPLEHDDPRETIYTSPKKSKKAPKKPTRLPREHCDPRETKNTQRQKAN